MLAVSPATGRWSLRITGKVHPQGQSSPSWSNDQPAAGSARLPAAGWSFARAQWSAA